MNDYGRALEHIHGLYRFGSRLGLARMRRLLAALGDPQAALRVIHVAGTNGKGSVSAMLAAILRAAGYRVGLYTSPYVVDFRERVSLDGRFIAPEDLARLTFDDLIPACRSLSPGGDEDADPVTEFEFITALGFLHFARERVDLAVVEVGLGGRFDATNVIDRPLLSVITSIGLDHTDRLGGTLSAIAAEKAGIIKRSTEVVSSPQDPAVLEVLAASTARRDGCLYVAGTDARPAPRSRGALRPGGTARLEAASVTGQRLSYRGPGLAALDDLHLPLLGRHQVENAASALTAAGRLRVLGAVARLDENAVRRGLAAVEWPGRFEIFGEAPPVVIDGAHNPPGARSLGENLRAYFPGRRLILVVGLLVDKDATSMLSSLLPPVLPETAGVVVCRTPNPRAMDPSELAVLISGIHPDLPVEVHPEVGEAVRRAEVLAGPDGVVCVAGSLYQVGEARASAPKKGPAGSEQNRAREGV